ncbi:ABC transporter substrate-binding protein [Tenggerimyces flavus]|uniref:ABC transporter substrate-binding protein n=1 Tax=Tenggerimyces flavus TaxID=1708749 RepID=A0ABV7Y7J5_9ACTN|nr:sugar ABC transporter substrate-binding protein [Tenggerimyces flavus]MBM7791178.1 multiple sugar transport system substrate-binding protein [Tenggerimyces flavus]
MENVRHGIDRRRFLSGAMAAAGAVGLPLLAGCGGDDDSGGSGGSGSIRVLAWSNSPSIDANFKARLKAFNDAQKGKIKATLQLLPYDQYWQKIQLAYSARQPYDIYYWDVQAYAHYKRGLLKDLQPDIDNAKLTDDATYPTNLYDPWKFDGKSMFGCPENVQTMVFFYNKDLFDKAGVKYPDDTWTWDDVITAAEKLTVRQGSKVTQWGLDIGDLSIWWGLQTLSWAQDTAFVDKELEPTKLQLSDPRNVESIAFIQDLIYKHKVAPSPTQTTSVAQDVGAFESGKIAMRPAGGWQIASYKKLSFKWAVAPLPLFKGKRVAPYWLGGWNIPKAGKAQEAAFEYAKWSASTFQPQMAKDHDWIPLRNAERSSGVMLEGMPDGFEQSIRQLDNSRIGDIYHANNLQLIEEVFGPTFEQLWNNKLKPEQAAKQMDDKGTALLKG